MSLKFFLPFISLILLGNSFHLMMALYAKVSVQILDLKKLLAVPLVTGLFSISFSL